MALTETQQIYEAIKNANSTLITFRPDHDGDHITASLALSLFLKKLDKDHEIVCHNYESQSQLTFLPQSKTINPQINNLRKFIISLNTANTKPQKIDYEHANGKFNIIIEPQDGIYTSDDLTTIETKYRHDLIITLGTPDLESLHDIYEGHTDFFYNTPILNIDHSTDNESFGHYNLLKVTSTSLSEIIYDLIEKIDPSLIDEEIATHLLAGMIIKTKSFKTSQVTPRTLHIASQLMASGADRESIIRNLYQTKSVTTLKLWGKVLQQIETNDSGKLAWSNIKKEDFENTKTTPSDIHEVIDELITNIPSIELTVIFFEDNEGTKSLIKAENNINLLESLQDYSPQGTKQQVQLTLNESSPQDLIIHLEKLVN